MLKSLFLAALLAAGLSVSACAAAPPPPAGAEAAQGEFEGAYQVGPTSCAVTPVKMAYEVRWAKGGGKPMLFFFDGATPDGKPVFASEDQGKGRDRFIFDDKRYDTGTFVRADGKVFALRRLGG